MPLAPQHFQESFRRAERLLDFHLGLVAPYHYGVTSLEIDGGRLGGGVLHVDVEAVMPDRLRGSAKALSIKLDADALRNKASAGPRRERSDEFDVYLTVPKERDGWAAVGDLARYRRADGKAMTDDTTGESALPIDRLEPILSLLVDVEPPTSSMWWIRIAKVRLNRDFFVRAEHAPPLLAVSREPHAKGLYDLCARLVERVRSTARGLSERRAALSLSVARDASGNGATPDDRERLVQTKHQIQSLVAALPPFESLLHTEQAHPFALYVALSGLVGSVAGLSRSLLPPVLSTYRHDDLLATFEEAATHVESMMREGIVETFAPHPLEAGPGRYQVEFPRAWSGRQLVLAVRALRGADVNAWMQSAIIASLGEAARVRGNRAIGVERERVPRIEDLFPAGGELLFKLNEASTDVVLDQPLTIFNPADSTGDIGAFEIVLYVKEPPSEPQASSLRSVT